MAHPKVIKYINGVKFHLEDTVTTKCEAEGLAKHLRNTEDKKACVKNTKDGFEVWWAK
jgi:hypothetical protein